jgi:SARP family transcriptional regulator, regulator of embCAB operon
LASTRIQVCGRLVAEIDGRRIERDLPGRQGRLLFAYLVASRLRSAGRDELAAAIWSDARAGGLSPLLSKVRRLVPLEGRGETRIVLPPDA